MSADENWARDALPRREMATGTLSRSTLGMAPGESNLVPVAEPVKTPPRYDERIRTVPNPARLVTADSAALTHSVE